MRRWNSYIEIIYFPLEVLYISSLLLGFTGLLLGSNIQLIFNLDQAILIRTLDMVRFLAALLIQYFPILFLLRGVYRRHEDGLVVVAGLLGYISFHVGTAFFIPTNMVSEAYGSILGIVVPASMLKTMTSGSLSALQTGLPGAILVLMITRFVVERFKKRSPYSLFSFVDKNVSVVFGTLFLSLIAGILAAMAAPYLVNTLQSLFSLISMNLNNPVNLFAYGVIDRVLSVFGYSTWMHQQFWFNTLGGSWSDALGSVYLGDVGMWTGQLAQGISGFGTGKLITPYYILNIFAVPAFILAAYQTYTDKIVRARLLAFVLISIVASMAFGTLLPIEIFMMFTTPLLFIFHLFITGLLFAILNAFGVAIGYTFSASVLVATPGSLVDLLVLIRNPLYQRSLSILLFAGLMTSLVYYAVSTFYYRKGAMNLINPTQRETLLTELMESIGGVENIKLVNASIGKLIIQVNQRELVDFKKIHHRVSKIVETKAGYALSYGASSYMLWVEIKAQLESLAKSA